MDDGYTIQLATPLQLQFLAQVERHAAQLFDGWNVPDCVVNASTPIEEFREIQRRGLLWVALAPTGEPVGFAVVEAMGATCHLEELDVDPGHARRGIGSALVGVVCDWAKQRGLSAVTLTTYRDIPFNAPLYIRLGFREIQAEQLSRALEERVREEKAKGLDPERRVVMRFDIVASGRT